MPQPCRRRLPEWIEGFGQVRPFTGAFANLGPAMRAAVRLHSARPGVAKVLPSLRAAIEACELKDGSTISFHHHLRNGDGVLNAVVAEAARMGLRDLTIAASSLFPVHAPWSSTSAAASSPGSPRATCPALWPTRSSGASLRSRR